jgi:hypothetical protein
MICTTPVDPGYLAHLFQNSLLVDNSRLVLLYRYIPHLGEGLVMFMIYPDSAGHLKTHRYHFGIKVSNNLYSRKE